MSPMGVNSRWMESTSESSLLKTRALGVIA